MVSPDNGLPMSYPVDATSEFQPGQIGQLKLVGQDLVVGLSDGTAPIGIIDDVRVRAFTQTVVDEIVLIEVPAVAISNDGYNYITNIELKKELNNGSLMKTSFVSDYDNIILNPLNGVVILPAGSRLNFSVNGATPDSVKMIVSYVYQVPNLPGDDTTLGSNRVTIWFHRGIYETDQFDTTQHYPINCTLFVNKDGKLTSKQPTSQHPGVAMLTGPPTALASTATIEFLWL